MDAENIKIVGRRVRAHGGLADAEGFLDLVVRLRGAKPFIPTGVHRFRTFGESQAWSIRMMARPASPGHQG
jgi:hypothetical protein